MWKWGDYMMTYFNRKILSLQISYIEGTLLCMWTSSSSPNVCTPYYSTSHLITCFFLIFDKIHPMSIRRGHIDDYDIDSTVGLPQSLSIQCSTSGSGSGHCHHHRHLYSSSVVSPMLRDQDPTVEDLHLSRRQQQQQQLQHHHHHLIIS